MEINMLSDPARFAQAIRELAREAHRTLEHSPTRAAVRRLSRRIECLSSVLADGSERPLPIATWLDNLGREVLSAEGRRGSVNVPGQHACCGSGGVQRRGTTEEACGGVRDVWPACHDLAATAVSLEFHQ
jgi:hypothetical protein